jgi:hypothetical protein
MDVQLVGAAGAAQQEPPAVSPPGAVSGPGDGLPAQPHVENTGALSPVVAKLLSKDGAPRTDGANISVSYRVEHDPNMIVTVFTDPATGEEIAQVPAEVMVQIAQFFDKHSGVTLDQNA